MARYIIPFVFLVSCCTGVLCQYKAVQCPDSFLITPCVCTLTGSQIDFVCSNLASLQSLGDIFARTFPTNELNKITIKKSQLGALPNDVFKGKSFSVIEFVDNYQVSFESKTIFSSSKTFLTSLVVRQETDNWSFDLTNVDGFNLLNSLEVSVDCEALS